MLYVVALLLHFMEIAMTTKCMNYSVYLPSSGYKTFSLEYSLSLFFYFVVLYVIYVLYLCNFTL